jgi:hypothetical protein
MFLELGEGGGTREERGGTREVMSLSLSLSLSLFLNSCDFSFCPFLIPTVSNKYFFVFLCSSSLIFFLSLSFCLLLLLPSFSPPLSTFHSHIYFSLFPPYYVFVFPYPSLLIFPSISLFFFSIFLFFSLYIPSFPPLS